MIQYAINFFCIVIIIKHKKICFNIGINTNDIHFNLLGNNTNINYLILVQSLQIF